MKKFIAFCLTVLFLTAGTASCVVTHSGSSASHRKSLPPGQAKKITGAKSAKAYAPGQRKKK